MLSVIRSEWLKYRRTLTPWFIVGGPLLLALAEFVFSLIAPAGRTWRLTLLTVYNWWVVLGLPLGSALLAALASSYERRSGAWRVLRSHPLSPSRLYSAKFAVLALHTAIATALFAVFILLTQFWHLRGSVPWGKLVLGTTVSWVSSLALLAVMLWCSMVFRFGVTVVLGLIGLISGVATSERAAWVFDPWAWPVRALEPIFGFHTNGLPLEANSPFWNTGVIAVASALGIVVAVMVTFLGSQWFSRTEVR